MESEVNRLISVEEFEAALNSTSRSGGSSPLERLIAAANEELRIRDEEVPTIEAAENPYGEDLLPEDIASVLDEVLAELDNADTIQPMEETTTENLSYEPVTTIPVNPNTLLVDESTSRFSSAEWYDKVREQRIVLAGLGGIGSYVAFLLSRLKPSAIYLYDPDIVETVNMSGQLYSNRDIGSYKVNAIYNMMQTYSGFHNGISRSRRYESGSIKENIMICGFDNMEARRTFFESWMNRVRSFEAGGADTSQLLFIDGRLAAEEFQVFAITGDNEEAIERYANEWLFADEEAEETLCSYKQTTFMANMIGSVMVNIFVNHIANQCNPIFPRDVPFMTSYDASTMYFKVEK